MSENEGYWSFTTYSVRANNLLVKHFREASVFEVVGILRTARVDEAPAIAALVNAATSGEGCKGWTDEAHLFDGRRTDADEVRDLLAVPGATFVLWTLEREIAGCAYLKPTEYAAYLGMLAVRPDRQGWGIGSEIIAECERVARDEWRRGVMRITVVTTHRPELAAYYERRGYRRTGRFKTAFERKQALRVQGLRPEWMEKSLRGAHTPSST